MKVDKVWLTALALEFWDERNPNASDVTMGVGFAEHVLTLVEGRRQLLERREACEEVGHVFQVMGGTPWKSTEMSVNGLRLIGVSLPHHELPCENCDAVLSIAYEEEGS